MIKHVLAGFVLVALSGCASSGRIGELPQVAASESSSRLVVIRASSLIGAANTYYVALDGEDVFSIRSGEYTAFPIPEGEHFVSVKCFGGWTPTWKEDAERFVARRDQSIYFEISPSMGCADIRFIHEEDGIAKTAKSSFVDPRTVSNK